MELQKEKSLALSKISLSNLWGRTNIVWEKVDPLVNIIVGDNGSGKTTLLAFIYDMLQADTKTFDKQSIQIDLQFNNNTNTFWHSKKKFQTEGSSDTLLVNYINTFDVPSSKKSAQSQLLQSLDERIYQRNPKIHSFSDYRLKMLNNPSSLKKLQKRIDTFFALIDDFFLPSGKKIAIDKKSNDIHFSLNDSCDLIHIEQLSSGEKQLLLILFTVFLQEDKPSILLMDEPETSLHIQWQSQLIEAIQHLNPNCQQIITTHSPSLFADGWGDKLVFMKDITE